MSLCWSNLGDLSVNVILRLSGPLINFNNPHKPNLIGLDTGLQQGSVFRVSVIQD